MEIRAATREELWDAEVVRIASWKVAYRGIVPDAVLDALAPSREKVTQRQAEYGGPVRTLLALDGDEPVGMAAVGPCRDASREGQPELYALYVLPAYWGTAVGQALWEAAQPVTSLWVLCDNARARRFYARNGLHPDITKEFEIGVTLQEIRYVRE